MKGSVFPSGGAPGGVPPRHISGINRSRKMNNKYEFTNETKTVGDAVLHRIRAIRDIHLAGEVVEAGSLGGWLEGEGNLAQVGDAWVFGHARVFGHAHISGDAVVSGRAEISGDSQVSGTAEIADEARVYGSAQVGGAAKVGGTAEVYGSARVSGMAEVGGRAKVSGQAVVTDTAVIDGRVHISGSARVGDDADFVGYKNPTGERGLRWLTYTRSDGMWQYDGFRGSAAELIAMASATGERFERTVRVILRSQEELDKLLI